MKYFLFTIFHLAILGSCAPKKKHITITQASDSAISKPTYNENITKEPVKKPLDTIPFSYPNEKKLNILVLEYHDSLLNKPIKDFEVRDAQTNDLVFHSESIQLVLGNEVDPINGIFDSLFVVPTYSVSPHTPLTVNLDFVVNGDFRKGYLGDVTYLFYKKNLQIFFPF